MIEIVGLLDIIGIVRAIFILWLMLKLVELYLVD